MVPEKPIFEHLSKYHRFNTINFVHRLLQVVKKCAWAGLHRTGWLPSNNLLMIK
jgi:hypothetical protein